MSQAGSNGGGGADPSILVETLTGNSGGAVGPTGNNINVVGSGDITVTGNPGTSTLTISSSATGLIGITDTASPFTTALGSGALDSASGVDNSALGYNAGTAISTGTDNVAIGYNALSVGTTTSFTTAIGTEALENNNQNGPTALGYRAGRANTSGGSLTALGYQAALSNLTGGDNTAIGSAAFQSNQTGSSNTAVGQGSLQNITSGSGNISLGNLAGSSLTGADSANIDIGHIGISGDSGVIRIGTSSTHTSAFVQGISGVTVSNTNIVTIDTSTGQLGSQAASASLIGITDSSTPFMTALGSGAGVTAAGIDNIAIGYNSLPVASTSAQCVALGSNSLLVCDTGINNICVGAYSGRKLTSGGSNTLIGTASGDLYGGTESGNICIGNGTNGITGESNALHIGDTGGSISSAYIGGIAGVTVSNAEMVTIDTSTGQLGSQEVPTATKLSVYLGTPVANVTGDGTNYTILFDTVTVDTASGYNAGTGTYTFPTTGDYLITYGIAIDNIGAAHTNFQAFVNGSPMGTSSQGYLILNPFTAGAVSGQLVTGNTAFLSVTAADTVNIGFVVSGGTKTIGVGIFAAHAWAFLNIIKLA